MGRGRVAGAHSFKELDAAPDERPVGDVPRVERSVCVCECERAVFVQRQAERHPPAKPS